MSASTEALIIEIIFCLGAIIALGGLIGLIVTKQRHRPLRPAMAVIISGVGIVIIASLLNVLLFKTYDQTRVKKDDYYEITSLTNNMQASLASSQAANQPVSPSAKKASKNVTYLVKHMAQPVASRQDAQTAQSELTQRHHPRVTRVKAAYQRILNRYFKQIVHQPQQAKRLSQYAYQQAIKVNH
ncbi:hypothetical protein IV54_GL000523 [Levilactobacillus paucivorans]|uniref:Uncharacterized protein n=1 Tax=Levilactobacillus paucivorans TaxID=616990 RepID=A0A0R2LPV1_9LACO|nr:hypothetical protein [Levilactobacillus paucivorans]KRO01165.1 hypothetical protein IV54_GL000523 [Levilactobacillus paucivorans]